MFLKLRIFLLLKTNLHFHSGEDSRDFIPYSIYQGIDFAKKEGFDAIALTCHRKFIFKEKFGRYAKQKGIVLIPGIELSLSRWKHVVVLNCRQDIENVSTIEALRDYKKMHPNIFILAPHPFFPGHLCLRGALEKNIDLFDAIEFSWFWNANNDFNRKAKIVAEKYDKPYISTSDTHFLKYLNKAYAIIESQDNRIESILQSVKDKKFKNFSEPLKRKDIVITEAKHWAMVYLGGRIKNAHCSLKFNKHLNT